MTLDEKNKYTFEYDKKHLMTLERDHPIIVGMTSIL